MKRWKKRACRRLAIAAMLLIVGNVLASATRARAQAPAPASPTATTRPTAPSIEPPAPPPPTTPALPAPLPQTPTQAPTAAPATNAPALANQLVTGRAIDPLTCEYRQTDSASAAPPVQWTRWELAGTRIDRDAPLRAIFDAYLEEHRALTASTREELMALARAAGYQLTGLGTKQVGTEVLATLALVPRPLIRRIDVVPRQSLFEPIIKEDIERHMQLRVGNYVGWAADLRACESQREARHLEDYLREQGFFEATVNVRMTIDGQAGAYLNVDVALGPSYLMGRIRFERSNPTIVTEDELRGLFMHARSCLPLVPVCFGTARFTRATHQADVQRVVARYHQLGYPGVRVQSDFDPATSYDRARKVVNVTIRIDERRQLDVQFEGHDPDRISEARLRELLTFNAAGSSDDVEVEASAAALTSYLQTRGYFDARVTWQRKREATFDRVVFRIEAASPRRVANIVFAGNRALSDATLTNTIGTQTYSRLRELLGTSTAAAANQLRDDTERIRNAYRKLGYRHTTVEVIAAPAAEGLANQASAAAAVALAAATASLHIVYNITEGPLTYLRTIEVKFEGANVSRADERATCATALALARVQLGITNRQHMHRAPGACTMTLDELALQEDRARGLAPALLDRLQAKGRRSATVEADLVFSAEANATLRLTLGNLQRQTMGQVLWRGNFRTRESIAASVLNLPPGAVLTSDRIAQGAAQLRATGLFDSVKIEFLDQSINPRGVVDAVVRVEERYERRFRIDVEAGYSFINGGYFSKAAFLWGNMGGWGTSLTVPLAVRFDLGNCFDFVVGCVTVAQFEPSLKIPRFVMRRVLPIDFDTELLGIYRSLPSPRFGALRTKGATLAVSRSWQRGRTEAHPARSITAGVRYDVRIRDREENAIRPAGANADQERLPVTTRTGALIARVEWEQRVDRRGELAPLAPEAGFRMEASVTFASPYLLGQATFVKASAAAQRYFPLGRNTVLRVDARYDHGIPLAGAAALPDVERFFSGGDATVRGYAEDRLASELILSAVPPLGNVQQLTVRPAGGNIRSLLSLDAQFRIFGPVASALFVDTGVVTNRWRDVSKEDIRTGVGMAFARLVTGFGTLTVEYAAPLRPRLGDDPRGRFHIGFAMRF